MSDRNPGNFQHTIKAFVRKGEDYYVAECLEIAVVTQGKTLDETITNLNKEAVALHLENEDLSEFGFTFHSQKGSHVKLRRFSIAGAKQTLTVPIHDELDLGTLHVIIR